MGRNSKNDQPKNNQPKNNQPKNNQPTVSAPLVDWAEMNCVSQTALLPATVESEH